mgnify:CR=1 FL=1
MWKPGNWSVTAQDPAAGAQVPTGQTITLTVNHDSAKAAASAAAEASASAAAAEQARQEAARAAEERAQQQAQQQVQTEPDQTQEQSDGSSGTYYANCADAWAAGAAPIYRGEPGYREKLDRDNDGIACEWK